MTNAYVYLLHFEHGLRQDAKRIARHYAGWTPNVEARLHEHQSGHGATLTRHVAQSGDVISVARIWQFDTPHEARVFERKLKNRNHLPRYCPTCVKEGK